MNTRLWWSYARAMAVLPGTVLVLVPAAIAWAAGGTFWGAETRPLGDPILWLGLAVFALGFALAGWTNRLFLMVGEGTPAPWDPPRRFVARGPYRHVRNPMMGAVFAMLAGEALVFASPGIAAWLALFMAGNALYIPLVEEPGLLRRFGADYEDYRRQVPRWLPRRRPWGG